MLNSIWDYFETWRNTSTVGITIVYKDEIITSHDALQKAELLGPYFINSLLPEVTVPSGALCFVSTGMILVWSASLNRITILQV